MQLNAAAFFVQPKLRFGSQLKVLDDVKEKAGK